MKLPIPLFKAKGISPEVLKKSYEEICASGQFTNFGSFYHKAVDRLEQLYPNKQFILCNNGTTTLTTILKATFPTGSRIAIPSFTFVATVNAILEAGMIPLLLPCSTEDWVAAPFMRDDVYQGVVVVSPFGNSPDYEYWSAYSRLREIPVIFDSAAGWGQDFTQTQAPISVSLHATKNLPIGEGGLIILDKNDHSTFEQSKMLIGFGLDADKNIKLKNGTNGKMDELHAAILLEQLNTDPALFGVFKTKALIKKYLADLSKFGLYAPDPTNGTPQLPVFHVGGDMALLTERAAKAGIATRRYYWPLLNQVYPEYTVSGVDYNDEYFSKFLALPKDLDPFEYEYVIKSLKG